MTRQVDGVALCQADPRLEFCSPLTTSRSEPLMPTLSRFRLWGIAFGALTAGAFMAVGSPAADFAINTNTAAWQQVETLGCPADEVVDEEVTGFRCVPQCPSGMMIDAQTHVCVAAPGVPPALPEVQIVPTPQI
jgi:hypothetical protein